MVFAVTVTAETVMVQALSGEVMVKNAGSGSWVKAKVKDRLEDATMLKVEQGSKIQMISKSGTVIKIDQAKMVQVSDLFTTGKTSDKIGSLRAKLSKNNGGSDKFAATAVAGVRGGDVSAQDKEALKKDLYWEP